MTINCPTRCKDDRAGGGSKARRTRVGSRHGAGGRSGQDCASRRRAAAARGVCSPVGSGFLKPRGRAASVGSAVQLQFTASLSVAKCQLRTHEACLRECVQRVDAYFATKVPIVWGYSFVSSQSRRSHEPPHRRPQRDANFSCCEVSCPGAMHRFADRYRSRRWRSPRCEHATREPPALSQHQRTAPVAFVARMSRQHGCFGERREQ
jgi:hypothetical protein